jgi:hypothetical protein
MQPWLGWLVAASFSVLDEGKAEIHGLIVWSWNYGMNLYGRYVYNGTDLRRLLVQMHPMIVGCEESSQGGKKRGKEEEREGKRQNKDRSRPEGIFWDPIIRASVGINQVP